MVKSVSSCCVRISQLFSNPFTYLELNVFIGMLPCPYAEDYRCPHSGICVRSYQLCDGYQDCSQGEDEQNCSMYMFC